MGTGSNIDLGTNSMTRVNRFQVHANQVSLTSHFGTLSLATGNSNNIAISASGAGQLSMVGNQIFTTSTSSSTEVVGTSKQTTVGGSTFIQSNSVSHTVIAQEITHATNLFNINKFTPTPTPGGSRWAKTLPDSFVCATGAAFISKPSLNFYEDMVLHTSVSIVTAAASGFVSIGPGIESCSGRFRASGGIPLSLEGELHNGIPGQPLVIHDADGLDVKNTTIYSSDGPVVINDSDGLDVKNTTIYSSDGSVNIMGSIFYPGGIINATMLNADSGSCCTSDLRVKKNITPMSGDVSLKRILSMRPIEYQWTTEYLKADPWVKDEVVRGFGAQDIAPLVPGAVRTKSKRVGALVLPDFHTLHKDALIPDLIAAFQALHEKYVALLHEVEQLKAKK
jgi:hypothetical protein